MIGRRIGIALFWSMAVFVIGASTRSVLIDLYGAPPPGGSNERCAAELRPLYESLLDRASRELRSPHDPARTEHWLRDWDRRFATTRDACGGLWATRRTLLSLRERVEVLLHDYTRDALPLAERIERTLQRFAPRPTHPEET